MSQDWSCSLTASSQPHCVRQCESVRRDSLIKQQEMTNCIMWSSYYDVAHWLDHNTASAYELEGQTHVDMTGHSDVLIGGNIRV